MTLTTEQIVDTLSKVTHIPPGLFEPRGEATRGNTTAKNFWCDTESDEYTVLINQKDEILQINSGFDTWNAQIIKQILDAHANAECQRLAAAAAPAVDPNDPIVALQGVPSAAPTFTNMPTGNINVINWSFVKQVLVDFIKLNPGCVWTLFDPANPACVNEATTHLPSVWDITAFEGDENDMDIFLAAHSCTVQRVADNVTAHVRVDVATGNVVYIALGV
jgi:hypothetical protein